MGGWSPKNLDSLSQLHVLQLLTRLHDDARRRDAAQPRRRDGSFEYRLPQRHLRVEQTGEAEEQSRDVSRHWSEKKNEQVVSVITLAL